MNVKDYFKDYPSKTECFQTFDGLIFHQEGDANLHAHSLGKKEVLRHRKTVEKVENVEKVDKTKKKVKES